MHERAGVTVFSNNNMISGRLAVAHPTDGEAAETVWPSRCERRELPMPLAGAATSSRCGSDNLRQRIGRNPQPEQE
jgi:hypothetical protein